MVAAQLDRRGEEARIDSIVTLLASHLVQALVLHYVFPILDTGLALRRRPNNPGRFPLPLGRGRWMFLDLGAATLAVGCF
jgi:hypothetical protein